MACRRFSLTRRALGGAAFALAAWTLSAEAKTSFAQWKAAFRPRALARGISAATYDGVMEGLVPDTTVYQEIRRQPEFNEHLWQYLNRRVSEFRIVTGQARKRDLATLLDRLEADYGVDRHDLLALWGMESSFGDVIDNPKYMRPVFPALAALAYGEPRRRRYWEQELLNALTIVERGWSRPRQMIGSWAGAMGHTQWMPEVWLRIGVDYDGDGRISPFGPPHDALAGSARYLVERGGYRRGEAWGFEVRADGQSHGSAARSATAWLGVGVKRADGQAFPSAQQSLKLWRPVEGGPAFLIGRNFAAVRSYNPSSNYALAVLHLSDRIAGGGPFRQSFPGSERALTLAEVQEVQRRLTAAGLDTGGVDGRVGRTTMRAVGEFQKRSGLRPVDGYAGLAVLERLRGAR